MQAIKQISEEKNISTESVIETIEAALAAAYRKDFGEKNQNIKVEFDVETGDFEVFDVKTVVEDMELPEEEEEEEAIGEPIAARAAVSEPPAKAAEEAPAPEGPVGMEAVIIEEKKFNPKTELMISDAMELKKDAEIGEEIRTQLEVPAAFGRMAAQTAKQVIIQKIREAERNKLFDEFKEHEHELINATVQRREGRVILIDLGRLTGVMPPDEQIPGERYASGDRLKVYVTEVRMTTKGPEVIVSRSHPDIVRKLFALEIPEVASGAVVIQAVAREAGARSKVAVSSTEENVDPIGSCIGQRGTRIQTIIAELGGEKIDVIQHDEDPIHFIMNALSPARVVSIQLKEDQKTADVQVTSDQLSLAIGRGGQNVRLASRLTGWKINIVDMDAGTGAADTPEGDASEDEGEEMSEGAETAPEGDGASDEEAADGESEEKEAGPAVADEAGADAVAAGPPEEGDEAPEEEEPREE